jgi:hypothetical protein
MEIWLGEWNVSILMNLTKVEKRAYKRVDKVTCFHSPMKYLLVRLVMEYTGY